MEKKKGLTREITTQILSKNKVKGKLLTPKQVKFFESVALVGKKDNGKA